MGIANNLTDFTQHLSTCRSMIRDSTAPEDAVKDAIYESALAMAFRGYENFVEATFLDCLSGDDYLTEGSVVRFASPRDANHARRMLLSSTTGRFLEWSDGQKVKERCQHFFDDDFRLLVALQSKSDRVSWMHKIRNHVAHNSTESLQVFRGVVRSVLVVAPDPLPTAGAFLQMRPSKGPLKNREVLSALIDDLEEIAVFAAG